jgi:WS/DGAT/MGAT family acyltransferase
VGRPIRRLSRYDLHCLAVETAARPINVGILAIVDGRSLCDAEGHPRLADVRLDLAARLATMPELRRVIHRPGRLAGRPLWVDDPAFRIEAHVGEVRIPAPADEEAVLAEVERRIGVRLDRDRPLWRLWLLSGLPDGRLGVLLIVHHALADGLTTMRLARKLLAGHATPGVTRPADADQPPAWSTLVVDNARSMLASAAGLFRPASWRRLRMFVSLAWRSILLSRGAPASPLNAPVGPRRRLLILRLDVATARRVARRNGGGVNDLVLSLLAGGIRALLEARAVPATERHARVGIAVALFSRDDGVGNDIGTLHVALPLGEPDPAARIASIAVSRNRAKASGLAAREPILRAWLGRSRLVRRTMERQRLVNLAETYLAGPTSEVSVLGAPVLDLVPLTPLTGNLPLAVVALSYAGRLALVVRVDPDRIPDVEVLIAAMDRERKQLGLAA